MGRVEFTDCEYLYKGAAICSFGRTFLSEFPIHGLFECLQVN